MLYLISFFVIVFVVSAVSAIVESKPSHLLRESIKMFVVTSAGMGIIAFVIFMLSR